MTHFEMVVFRKWVVVFWFWSIWTWMDLLIYLPDFTNQCPM